LLLLALIAVAREAVAEDAKCVREHAAMIETIRANARSDAGLLGRQGISESVLEAMGQTQRYRFIPGGSCSLAYADRSAWVAGLYFPQLPKLPKLDFRVEGVYTDVPAGGNIGHGFFYFNLAYRNGYTNDGNLIGSWIGRQGQGAQAGGGGRPATVEGPARGASLGAIGRPGASARRGRASCPCRSAS